MRYRRKLKNEYVVVQSGLSVCAGAYAFLRQHQSLLTSLLVGALLLLFSFVPHLFWYSEIRDDCVVQRRYFGRTVFPFSEITYVGPMTGRASEFKYFEKFILIRNVAGKRMIVDTGDPEAFLAEMRKHLPRITLNL